MKRYQILAFAFFLTITGCQTTELWRSTPQDEYVKIVSNNTMDDVEAKLKTSGREYYCADLYKNNTAPEKVCYTKVTTAEKTKNAAIKLLKTPQTLVLDAGKSIYVIGDTVISGLFKIGYHN